MIDVQSFCERHLGAGSKSGGEYIYSCPNGCGHTLWVNPDKGVYHCFVCCSTSKSKQKIKNALSGTFCGSGNVYMLAAYFNELDLLKEEFIPPPKVEEFHLTETCRLLLQRVFKDPVLSTCHQQYLQSRGVVSNHPANIASSDYLSQYFSSEEKTMCGVCYEDGSLQPWAKKGRLLIPYYSKQGSVIGIRSRSILSISKQKFLWVRGTSASKMLYGINFLTPEKLEESGGTVIVTEGEIKSIVCSLHTRYPCVGIPGINTGINHCANLIAGMKEIKKVVVCFDTEVKETTGTHVEEAEKSLLHTLMCHGVAAKVAHLPVVNNKSTDIDSYLLSKGRASFEALVENII